MRLRRFERQESDHAPPGAFAAQAAAQGGFTLIEVLLSVSIAAAVVGVTVLSLRIGADACERGLRRSGDASLRRYLAYTLTREIGSAKRYGAAEDGASGYLLKGGPGGVTFITGARPPGPAPWGGASLNEYAWDGEALEIRRSALPSAETMDKAVERYTGVKKAAFFFLPATGGEWVGSWDSNVTGTLPRMVRAELVFSDGRGIDITAPIQAGAGLPAGPEAAQR